MADRKTRIPIPRELSAAVLYASDRTCCVCRERGNTVQVHHIDENPANNDKRNLAVLCLECHNETQQHGGFGKTLTAELVTIYRDEWEKTVAAHRAREQASSPHDEADRESDELRKLHEKAEEVARRRATGESLLDGAIRMRLAIGMIEPIHDKLSSRIAPHRSFNHAWELEKKAEEDFRRVGRDLAIAPNTALQRAIEKFGDAELAYFGALTKPFSETWNVPQFFFGKTPQNELDRLRGACDVTWAELKDAVRAYSEGVEQSTPTEPK